MIRAIPAEYSVTPVPRMRPGDRCGSRHFRHPGASARFPTGGHKIFEGDQPQTAAARQAGLNGAKGSRTKSGPKEHPLIRHEREERALESRLLQKLGLDVEAVRPSVGRPGGRNVGVSWEDLHGDETETD